MTNPLGQLTTMTTRATGAAGEGPERPAMDREAFLKLLVAQLSHQDPLQPMQGTEFVSQLSQFAMVEQAIAQSNRLDVVSTQMRGLANNEAAGLVGSTVTVRGRGIAFDGTHATGASVNLSAPAARVTATLRDANGRVVRTLQLGPRPAGTLAVQWDGRDDAGNALPRGNYTVSVTATTEDGRPVGVSQDVTGVVTRVSFDRGYPELTLDTGATAPISDLVSVGGGNRPREP